MNRDTFIALAQAWMRSRGLSIAREGDTQNTGIATLHGSAEREVLLDLTRVLDDAVKYGLEPALRATTHGFSEGSPPPSLPRTVTPDRAPTIQIPPDVLATALARSRAA